MKKNVSTYISTQVLSALVVFFGLNSTGHAKMSFKDSSTQYKAEKCDCMGYSDGIPTFLSDLAQGIDIYGEGASPQAAKEQAQNMCVESYRNFASISVEKEKNHSVSYSGCQIFKSQSGGEWVAL